MHRDPEPNADVEKHQRWLEQLAGSSAGRAEAVKGLFGDFQKPFLRYLQGRHRLSEADAKDLMQEVWMHLYCRKATYDPARGAPSPWLFRIVRNKRVDAFRRLAGKQEAAVSPTEEATAEAASGDDSQARPVDAEWLELLGETSAPSLETEQEARDIQRCVQTGLAAFTVRNEDAADLLWAQHALGWTVKEIAAYRGGSETAASTYLSDSRKRFKPYIERCMELITRSRRARKHGHD